LTIITTALLYKKFLVLPLDVEMKRSTAPLISEAHKYLGDQISSRLTNTQRAPELLEQFVSGNFRIVNPDTGETSISPKYFTTSSSGKIIENT
jgi:hypothetical protein